MNVTLQNGPQANKTITLTPGKIMVLIGRNGSGKSKILKSIKDQHPQEVLLLSGSYEGVGGIEVFSPENIKDTQLNSAVPVHVSSVVAADPHLLSIFRYFFKVLFDADLKINQGRFYAGQYELSQDADGVKAIFNLFYYLVSEHKTILLDEPERFFHPTMRNVFLNILSEVARNYNKTIIISSHSTDVIRFDIGNLQVFRVEKSGAITDITQWLSAVANVTYPSNRDKQQFSDWFKFHSRLLFGSAVCLVEGTSDEITLLALKHKFSLKHGFEHLAIEHVASSHHEAGGKSRLHKIQSFLKLSIPSSFVIADLDIIAGGIQPWYAVPGGEVQADTIANAKAAHLHILSKGEIEDYYFTDPSYSFCSSAATAKANKIAAAYEQARIIADKPAEEVEQQFKEIIDVFKHYITTTSGEDLLKKMAKEYLLQKNLQGQGNPHIDEATAGTDVEISMKFNPAVKFIAPKEIMDRAKKVSDDIDQQLKVK